MAKQLFFETDARNKMKKGVDILGQCRESNPWDQKDVMWLSRRNSVLLL